MMGSGAWAGVGMGMDCSGHKVTLGGYGSVLKGDSGDGCTAG